MPLQTINVKQIIDISKNLHKSYSIEYNILYSKLVYINQFDCSL